MSTTGPAGALLTLNLQKGNGVSAPADRPRESAGQRLAWTREMERVQLNTWFKTQLPDAAAVTSRPQNSGALRGIGGTSVKDLSAPAGMLPAMSMSLEARSESASVEPPPMDSFDRPLWTHASSRPKPEGSQWEAKADDEGLESANSEPSSATLPMTAAPPSATGESKAMSPAALPEGGTLDPVRPSSGSIANPAVEARPVQTTEHVHDASCSAEMPLKQARLDSAALAMTLAYRPASTTFAAGSIQASAAVAPLQAEQPLMASPQHGRSGDIAGAAQSVPRAEWALARTSAGQPLRPSVQSGAPVAPVRLHEESTLEGQAVWIAVRADDVQLLSMMAQWVADLERGMRLRGDRLHQVVCNGRLVWRDGAWHSDAPTNAASPADSGIPFNANPSQED